MILLTLKRMIHVWFHHNCPYICIENNSSLTNNYFDLNKSFLYSWSPKSRERESIRLNKNRLFTFVVCPVVSRLSVCCLPLLATVQDVDNCFWTFFKFNCIFKIVFSFWLICSSYSFLCFSSFLFQYFSICSNSYFIRARLSSRKLKKRIFKIFLDIFLCLPYSRFAV